LFSILIFSRHYAIFIDASLRHFRRHFSRVSLLIRHCRQRHYAIRHAIDISFRLALPLMLLRCCHAMPMPCRYFAIRHYAAIFKMPAAADTFSLRHYSPMLSCQITPFRCHFHYYDYFIAFHAIAPDAADAMPCHDAYGASLLTLIRLLMPLPLITPLFRLPAPLPAPLF